MNRCDTCRFWTRTFAGTVMHDRDPVKAARQEEWGSCVRFNSPDALMRPGATGWEVEEDYLDTHETFGCVQHEPTTT